ncbi:MAG: hypothetical protein ACTHM0_04460 [Sphingomonas sp.]|jgi:hypothetical protein
MPTINAGWYGVALCLAVAVFAGIADWRRRKRRDLDRMGPLHWPTVQMLALIVAAAIAAFVTHR